MRSKMVSRAPEEIRPLTQAQLARLRKLAAAPDATIDTSDIPERAPDQWAMAVRGKFYRPIKRQITARIDADVLEWLKGQGKGYQSRMNAILRGQMLEDTRSQRSVISKLR